MNEKYTPFKVMIPEDMQGRVSQQNIDYEGVCLRSSGCDHSSRQWSRLHHTLVHVRGRVGSRAGELVGRRQGRSVVGVHHPWRHAHGAHVGPAVGAHRRAHGSGRGDGRNASRNRPRGWSMWHGHGTSALQRACGDVGWRLV